LEDERKADYYFNKAASSFLFIANLIGMCYSWMMVLSVIGKMDKPCCDGNAVLMPFPVIPLPLHVCDRLDFSC